MKKKIKQQGRVCHDTTLTGNVKDKQLDEEGERHEEEEVPEEDERQPLLILSGAPYLLENRVEILSGAHLARNAVFRRKPRVLISAHDHNT